MANYLINDTQLSSIANAIRSKSGNNIGLTFPDGFVNEIMAISGENNDNNSNNTGSFTDDVVFYDNLMNDAQGGIVCSYTAEEFLQLDAMPTNPYHGNFITHGISIPMLSQGWNWSLADAKAHVTKYRKLNIGQMYIPIDGKSHWICYVPEDAPVERWNTEIHIGVSGGSVNWQIDDGTTSTASGNISVTFPSVGWHDVKISAPSGVTYYPYYNSGNKSNELIGKIQKTIQVFLGSSVTSINDMSFQKYYSLTSVTIPNNVTSIGVAFDQCYSLTSITIPSGVKSINGNTFYSCYSLTTVTIPNSIISIGAYAFYYCRSLASITIPDPVTSIGDNAFFECCSLTFVTIPNKVTSIKSNVFQDCYSLTSIIIPDSVTSIGASAFQNCYSLKNIIMEKSTPPTLSNTNAFSYLMSDYTIIVPAGSRSAYTSASKWSSLADHIVEATA